MHRSNARLRVALPPILFALLALPGFCATISLQNNGLSVQFDDRTGALAAVTNRLTSESYKVKGAAFSLECNTGALEPGITSDVRLAGDSVEFDYELKEARVVVRYTAPAGRDFLRKTIRVTNTGSGQLIIHKLAAEQLEFSPAFSEVRPHYDPSQFHWLINVFLRDKRGGLYVGIENPVFRHWLKGTNPATTWLQFDYGPNFVLAPGESATGDHSFLGSFRFEGIYLFKELVKLRSALASTNAVPTALNFDQELLDWGEVWAMQDFVRALQPAHEPQQPGFYVLAVAMVGGSKTAAMGEASGFHIAFGPEHVAGSKRFIDELVSLGHVPHAEWATEWFGVGGYGNPTKDYLLENAGPGDKTPVNPYWEQVVKYGWTKGIQASVFETVGRDFARKMPQWKVLRRTGTPWVWGAPPQPVNCWANPEYVRWRLQVTDEAIRDFRLYMVSWDSIVPADWSWLGWPVPETQCFATNHGHLPGDISYPAFRNIIWFLDELQQRNPKVSLRAASGLTMFYPWALKDLIEYHPNFYDGETGATYWTSYNFRFLPMYKSGVLLSATSQKQFEWLLLRSISVSDHLMLWPDAVPIALQNRAFWTKWLNWADKNIDYLRVGRTLFREPWGDHVVASLPPALEGALPAPESAVHGSAHCIKDRGVLFLFNPSSTARVAAIPLNRWIGLTEGKQFVLRELYPGDSSYGPYREGEEVRIEMPPNSVMVQEIAPAKGTESYGKPRISGQARVDKAFLRWKEIPWNEIQPRP